MNKAVAVAAFLASMLFAASAHAQDNQNKLPAQLEGIWENTEQCCFSGPIRVTVSAQEPDGRFSGTFYRTTPHDRNV